MSHLNPFLALFGSSEETPLQKSSHEPADNLDWLVESVFLLTLKSGQSNLVFMQDLAQNLQPQDWFDKDSLEQAVFEYCVGLPAETPVVDYLFECYLRSCTLAGDDGVKLATNAIFSNLEIALLQPDMFPSQDVTEQLVQLLTVRSSEEVLRRFICSFADFHQSQEEHNLGSLLKPVFHRFTKKLREQHLFLSNFSLLDSVRVLCSHDGIAESIVTASILNDGALGYNCENTILGSVFSTSCIAKHEKDPSDFFDHPSRASAQIHSAMEGNIWTSMKRMIDKIHSIVYNLLKSSKRVQSLTRRWIGQVLALNKERGQTWAQQHTSILKANCASDGFMINLASVLLKLCEPMTCEGPKASQKLSTIDPWFCATPADKIGEDQGIHMDGLYKETCLISSVEDEVAPCRPPFSFMTELFFLTHRALELANKAVHGQLVRLSQDLSRLQRAYQDSQGQSNSEVAGQIQQRMDHFMSIYLSCKAALLEPESLKLHLNLVVATSRWLCSVALNIPLASALTFPLPSERVQVLAHVPEFCVSNITDSILFLNRFAPSFLEQNDAATEQLLTFIIVFMGSPHRLKNPHLRAALAEMLDALTPIKSNQPDALVTNSFLRDTIFVKHPYAKELVATLLHVFCSIEMTGQGVAFEQKFNYRRPMYSVIKYLWNLKVHRRQFQMLAAEAEANMEAAQPPQFLQFCNLLINDAIYLLDEALSYMSQLREQQQQTDQQQQEMPAAQRAQRESSLQHMSMLARFHNVMGLETIRILELMTQQIDCVFVHATMADRVASMLNYFLLHLVGPKKRDFKVKDFGEYDFEPGQLVYSICSIYCHLAASDAFCTAVSQDGRSYSPQLFVQAEDVLNRTRNGHLIVDLRRVAERAAQMAYRQASDEDLIAIAPDEFIDPIMSCIMMNPVILPSSKVTVDRSTIARHLLSDQTDPFNRSPLTMEQVLADHQLRDKIHAWLHDHQQKN